MDTEEKKDSNDSDGNLTLRDMKRKPIFKDIFLETGHPEHAINNIKEQLEDIGFDIEDEDSSVSNDDVAEGVKTYSANIDSERTEKEYRDNAKTYKTYFWIGLGVSIVLTLLVFAETFFIGLALIAWISTFILKWLSTPKIKKDYIWLKIKGKIYSGTKARETRDSGKNNAGVTRTASTVYVYSELTISIAGDSDIDIKRVRDDVTTLSKYIQKL
jgi:Fe2+ transport system protein B